MIYIKFTWGQIPFYVKKKFKEKKSYKNNMLY